jgi:hypothetical protein
MKRYLAILAGFMLLAPAVALAATDPAGMWEGSVKAPQGDMGVVFNLHRDGNRWAGEMDVPMQNVTGLPLANVKVDGAAITFTMPGQGDPHYVGKLSNDGKSIAGNLNAGGQQIPLDLKWKSAPRAVEKAATVNTGDVQSLEGVWEGILEVQGMQLHVRFNLTRNADGGITATFDSTDQGVNGVPIAAVSRSGDTVKFDLKTVSITYEGTLNKDASEMKGTFTQGDGVPLDLQRKKAEKKN